MTYETWYTQYLQTYKRDLAPKTRESYDQVTAAYILPACGGLDLEQLTPEHVQAAINAAADHGGRQAQVVYSLMHAVLRRACRSWLIPRNPADAIDKPGHLQEEGKALTAADYADAAPLIDEDLALCLALRAGLRRGEIAGLQWGDIDLAARTLRVRRQRCRVRGDVITKTPKSAAGVRDVPIAPELLALLKAEYKLAPTAWVVDLAPEAITRRWARMQRSALHLQEAYRLHDLRHTYGSHLVLDGVNLRVVQYLMGHSSISITMKVYSHCRADDAAQELRRVYG